MSDFGLLRIGHGHDIHALQAGYEMWLGGVLIEDAEQGFCTHSDGDVLSHAIVDALAGAMADGDLGTHYPENDPNAENARSLEFVAEFAGYMRSRGYELINLDSFITLSTTRLRPYLAAIRANVAAALKISEDVVSVKGRSHDGIGEVGRGEACSATVSVLLRQEKSI